MLPTILGKIPHMFRRRNGAEWKMTLASVYFDWRFGLDTRWVVSVDELATDSELCNEYEATDWFSLNAILEALDIPNGSVFLDVGAGKGRALLIASRFGFQRIVGWEIAEPLCEIARKNIGRYAARNKISCKAFEILHCDGSASPVPDDINFLFLSNPFARSQLTLFLESLDRSLAARPRRVTLIYHYPSEHDLLAERSGIRELKIGSNQFRDEYKIYELGAEISGIARVQ